MYSNKDREQVKEKGIGLDLLEQQLENFKTGFSNLNIHSSAIIGNGVTECDEKKISQWNAEFENRKSISKEMFIPASGAATRMFKTLLAFYNSEEVELKDDFLIEFFKNIKSFAFYDDLRKNLLDKNEDLEKLLTGKRYKKILKYFLKEEGLNYANLPKGLLKFHQYYSVSKTALEEQLVEAALYCKSDAGTVKIHATVSPDHVKLFIKHVDDIVPSLEKKYTVKYQITLTEQKGSTDIISVDMSNEPYRDEKGSFLFRPGGHGALLENLNQIESDIIFVKNIDNIVPDRLKQHTVINKKILAGALLSLRNKICEYLNRIDDSETNIDNLLPEIINFLKEKLCIILPTNFSEKPIENKVQFLKNKLDRPVRVCGMVKNEGEPGGGPFWVKNEDGSISLQIVESSQIDMKNDYQVSIFNSSTHFNPVDLVCFVNNCRGEKFDLLKYRNPSTGLITKKSVNGEEIQAQELPGLWNGSMYDWNTIFIEVPLITFNPVKTINDLLREQHKEY